MRSYVIGIPVVVLVMLAPFAAFADFFDGLILYLPFDEGNGDVAKDVSGNGHDGQIDNPEWVDGKFGKALHFGGEGSGTFVTVESTPDLNVNEMTFMAWINAEHWNGTRQIVGKSVHGGCGGRMQYGLFSEGGSFKLRFETAGGRVDIITALPPVGEWVHVAVTNDGSEGKIFINGEEVASGAIPGALNANEDPWRVGQDCDRENYIFAGIIDEVRLWNRALSVDEIRTFMDMGVKVLAVEPGDKLPVVWGRMKSQ